MSLGEEYLPYREFCKETNYNLTYQSQDYNCDGIHYIIANSNWKTPENRETNNACINCTKLSSIIYTREKADDYKKEKLFLFRINLLMISAKMLSIHIMKMIIA